MTHIRCAVDYIVYASGASDCYTVIRAHNEECRLTAVGSMPGIERNTTVDLYGTWSNNPKYGRQFSVGKFVVVTSTAKLEGIEKYFITQIPGIGEKYAHLIANKFGEDTLEILEKNPEKILEVEEIDKKKAEKMVAELKANLSQRELVVFLLENGISLSLEERLTEIYGTQVIQTIRKNPYCLINDINGIGFIKADTIARKIGFDLNNELRIKEGIKFTLTKATQEGHCFLPRDQLISDATKLLKVEKKLVDPVINICVSEHALVREGDKIYLHRFYRAENYVASQLAKIYATPTKVNLNPQSITEFQKTIERNEKIYYNSDQTRAIETALTSKIMVLTGGPGTGKTTTTLGIIAALKKLNYDIHLVAPTGRAAKRMSEATGSPASTIHRLLSWEFSPNSDKYSFHYNEDNKLPGDAIIIDEFSMVDILLMEALIKALPIKMKIIFIGDADQLPSVGPGNVLHDIIDSNSIPVVHLKEIFRQAQDSNIIMNAHKINEGKLLNLSKEAEDFRFIPAKPYEVEGLVSDCIYSMSETYNLNPLEDIQVLSPMKKGAAGTENLNGFLQSMFHNSFEGTDNPAMPRGGNCQFFVGDKVMQIRNNYTKDVFNGEVGFITGINPRDLDHFMTVSFGDRIVTYRSKEIDNLILAYASTIHKAQGSEYPVVIIPLFRSHYIMLQRNLLYTAVTRAKKTVILIGDPDAVNIAIRNVDARKRNTQLGEKLKKCIRFQQG